MHESKVVLTPLGHHIKLSKDQWSVLEKDTTDELFSICHICSVGSIKYSIVCSRLDVAFVISVVNRYIENPGKAHLNAFKWILRYIKGSVDLGMKFISILEIVQPIIGYNDSNFAANIDT